MESIVVGSVNDPIKSHHNQVMGTMNTKEYLETIFGPGLYEEQIPLWDKIKNTLNSHYAHITIIGLVLLDIVCVTGELVISFDIKGQDPEKAHSLHTAENVFKYSGLVILCIFMVELMLKLIFVNKDILKSKLEVFDAVIILVSFVAEMVFLHENTRNEIEAIGISFDLYSIC